MADQATTLWLHEALTALIGMDNDISVGDLQHAALRWQAHRVAVFFSLGASTMAAHQRERGQALRIPPSFTSEEWTDFTQWVEELRSFKGATDRSKRNIAMLRTLISDYLALLDAKYADR